MLDENMRKVDFSGKMVKTSGFRGFRVKPQGGYDDITRKKITIWKK